MGDPLSIAASVGGLLSLGLQSTQYLYDFYAAYRDTHQELARIVDQLTGLRETLEIILSTVQNRIWRHDEQRIVRVIEDAVKRSEDTIHALQDEVNKFKQEPKDDWRKKAIIIGRRAAYPFKRSTLEDLNDDVNTFRDNLSIALQALQLKDHQTTHDEIQVVNNIVKSIQAHSLSASVRKWLSAPDATVDFNIACGKRHPGTGQWLVQGSAFTTWLNQENSFLWLHGFAGCGKSVLCSTAIQHVFLYSRSLTGAALAFFFFTFNDESKGDVTAALRTLLLQLSSQIPSLETELSELQAASGDASPPLPTLLEHLQSLLRRCQHVYIVLDALDESSADSSRSALLSVLQTIRGWQEPSLHLLVTSRDLQDIRGSLQFPRALTELEQVALKNDGIRQDISEYVAYSVDHDPKLSRWGAERDNIKEYLIDHADGVFRWVECQLAPLRTCARSQRVLERCLKLLPRDLDQTYERILCQIGDESYDEAQRILSLLCFAPRPLTVPEVIEATAVDLDDLECYYRGRRFDDSDDLLRLCPGLIEVSLETRPDDDQPPAEEIGLETSVLHVQVVRIAHFSVQEYLLSDRIRNGRAADFAMSAPIQHARISKACLLYLSDSDFLQETFSRALLKHYALADYAAGYWHHHYELADGQLAEWFAETIARFLVTDLTRERWARLLYPRRKPASAIYYACRLGLDRVLHRLLSTATADPTAQAVKHSNALVDAAVNGHERVVRMLLDRGVDVNAQSAGGGTALQAASLGGRKQLVEMLIDKGADVNAPGSILGGALQSASMHGHVQVVRLLLENGADVNAKSEYGATALHRASEHGSEAVVQMLLDKGADIDAPGTTGQTALHTATRRDNERVVAILLDRGAEVNAQDRSGVTPLHEASGRVVEMLLDRGADINHLSFWGSALDQAANRGNAWVVQTLLDRGADINVNSRSGSTALHSASEYGFEAVVQTLLDNGADVDAPGSMGETALHKASRMGHERVVGMLLDRGADINARSGWDATPLHQAVLCGNPSLVLTLLDRGADIDAKSQFRGSVLKHARDSDQENIVQMLLDRGATSDLEEE